MWLFFFCSSWDSRLICLHSCFFTITSSFWQKQSKILGSENNKIPKQQPTKQQLRWLGSNPGRVGQRVTLIPVEHHSPLHSWTPSLDFPCDRTDTKHLDVNPAITLKLLWDWLWADATTSLVDSATGEMVQLNAGTRLRIEEAAGGQSRNQRRV